MTPNTLQGLQIIFVIMLSTLVLCPMFCWTLSAKKA